MLRKIALIGKVLYKEGMTKKKPLKILLAVPHGFCAGVQRAISIVERALEKYGSPVYVRHEIVHNKFVVEGLRSKGAVFVDELDEIPDDGQPVIFSAHGVSKSVPQEASRRGMFFVDATCPLVNKVHREAKRHYKNGSQVILIGHAGHPEVIGTMGQLPKGAVLRIDCVDDVSGLKERVCDPDKLAYCSQTTLSVDDTVDIVAALKLAFPAIKVPPKGDICYATTNRQMAMKEIARLSDMVMVLGAPNSSNSNRLVEVAALNGCKRAILLERAYDIDWALLEDKNVRVLGLSAGASAPEVLIDEVIEKARENFEVVLEEVVMAREDVVFKLPKVLK